MKPFIYQQCLLVLFALMILSPPAFSLETVAIMDLKAIGTDQSLTEAVSENLRTMLIVSGAFKVVERSQLEKILKEYQLSQLGLTDTHAIKVGGIAEATRILVGSITKMLDIYTINARLLDVETGICVLGHRVDIQSEAEFPDKIDELARYFSNCPLVGDEAGKTPEIIGSYQVKGSDYTGVLHIDKHKEAYRISWNIDNSQTNEPDQTLNGVGILHNNMLSVNYAELENQKNTGVGIYEVLLGGKRLRGLYTSVDNGNATGKLRFENGEKLENL